MDQNGGHIEHLFQSLSVGPTLKPLLLQMMCVEVFSRVQDDFLCKLGLSAYISDVLIDVAPSSVLAFIKIKLGSRYLLLRVVKYVSRII